MHIAIALYASAMIAANLLVAAFGPAVIPINAFVFIGLDLVLRDVLQARLKPWQMLSLIAATGLLSWALNSAAGHIALASTAAFIAATLADWLVFSKLRGSWFVRSNGSNVVGAVVDSLVFPLLAFGALMPGIVATMVAAKIAGGLFWSVVAANAVRTPPETKDEGPYADYGNF